MNTSTPHRAAVSSRIARVLKQARLAWILGLTAASAHAQAPQPLRVLFIGNSYTYYHQMPSTVAALAQASGVTRPLEIRQETIAGTPLTRVLATRSARQAILDAKWDFVVFQIMPYPWLDRPADVTSTLKELLPNVRAAGAQPVYYLTWSGDARPDALVMNPQPYIELARDTEAKLAPAGKAWVLAKSAHASLPLVETDGHHPSPLGALLAACVIHRTLHADSSCKPPTTSVVTPEQMALIDEAARRAIAEPSTSAR